MSLVTDTELAEFRALAESRMTSRVVVMRRAADPELVDDLEVDVWAAVHIDLPFRLDTGASGGSRTVTIGGVEYQQATAVGHMPAGTVDLADDDLLEITAGEWAGTVVRIVEAVKGDQKTARRVPVVEETRPTEWS